MTLATFMEVLDTSIANVALPHISGSLGAGQDESTWVLTSYLVANAIILPMSSWLSLIVGRKRFYMSCVFLFTISSMMCGFAPSLPLLIFFRVLQGASGGGLGPSEQAILADTFPPEKRGMAFAIYGMAVVVAPVLGPIMGGYITDNYSWRWIFFINVPVGILSLILVSRMIQDPPALKAERQRRLSGGLRIDYIGMSLLALGLGSLQYVLDRVNATTGSVHTSFSLLSIVAVVCLVVVVFWEARQKQPVFDVSLFRSRSYTISMLMMFMVGFVLYGSTTLLPLMVQTLFGYSATNAGWVLTPGGIVIVIMMPHFRCAGIEVPGALAAGDWLCWAGIGPPAHESLRTWNEDYKTFLSCAHLPKPQPGIPVHPDQHRRVYRCAAGEEQRRVLGREPDAQSWWELRYRYRRHNRVAETAISPQHPRGARVIAATRHCSKCWRARKTCSSHTASRLAMPLIGPGRWWMAWCSSMRRCWRSTMHSGSWE